MNITRRTRDNGSVFAGGAADFFCVHFDGLFPAGCRMSPHGLAWMYALLHHGEIWCDEHISMGLADANWPFSTKITEKSNTCAWCYLNFDVCDGDGTCVQSLQDTILYDDIHDWEYFSDGVLV